LSETKMKEHEGKLNGSSYHAVIKLAASGGNDMTIL